MKLINAIRIIEEREKRKRKAEKENRRNGSPLNNFVNRDPGSVRDGENNGQKNLVHVQSIFPQEDVIALKIKTGESHVRDAISKAVYYYLKSSPDECN